MTFRHVWLRLRYEPAALGTPSRGTRRRSTPTAPNVGGNRGCRAVEAAGHVRLARSSPERGTTPAASSSAHEPRGASALRSTSTTARTWDVGARTSSGAPATHMRGRGHARPRGHTRAGRRTHSPTTGGPRGPGTREQWGAPTPHAPGSDQADDAASSTSAQGGSQHRACGSVQRAPEALGTHKRRTRQHLARTAMLVTRLGGAACTRLEPCPEPVAFGTFGQRGTALCTPRRSHDTSSSQRTVPSRRRVIGLSPLLPARPTAPAGRLSRPLLLDRRRRAWRGCWRRARSPSSER